MNQLSRHAVLVAFVGLTLASTAAAQKEGSSLGPQLGVATNSLGFFIGAQFSHPVAKQIDIYPSFQYYFPGNAYGGFGGVNVTVWSLNAEGRYWPKLNTANSGLYVGGGINLTHVGVSVGGIGGSTTDAGLGLLGGWDFKAVSWRPFAQVHIVIGNADRIEFGGGINFKL